MRHPWSGLGSLPRGIWILFSVSLVNRMGTMFLPFLVLYLTRHLGLTPGRAASMLALYGLVGIAVAPVAGRLADRWGAERIMKLSLFSSGTLLVFFPFVRSFAGVAALTAAIALTAESFRPANMSLATHVVAPADRKAAFSLLRLAINLGMSVGPAAGGFLAAISFPALFRVDGATSILAGLVLVAWPVGKGAIAAPDDSPEPARAHPLSTALADRRFVFFLLALLPVVFVFFQHIAALPLFLVQNLGRSESTFGLLFTLNTLLVVLFEVPINLRMAGVSHGKALFSGSLLVAAGFGLYGIPGGLPVVVLGTVVWSFGEMVLLPGLSSFVAEVAPPALRGTYMGLYSMTFSVGFALAPWLGATLLERAGATILWISMFVLGSLSAVLLARARVAVK
jgi:MFS family permease